MTSALLALALLSATSTTKVLVLDVAGEALSREERGALRDTLASNLAKRKGYDVLTSEDVRRVLDVEAQKQALGCEGQSDCLAEIGAALGADRVLYASVARLGEKYVVNLSLVDPLAAKSSGRDTFEADDVGDVSNGLNDSADRVFGKSLKKRGGDDNKGAPVLTITGGVIAGVGLIATVGLGAVTAVMADTLQDPNASASDKQRALEEGPTYLIITGVSAGVLALGALVAVVGLAVE